MADMQITFRRHTAMHGRFETELPADPPGPMTMVVECALEGYDFARHFRYARHAGGEPYTFPHFTFHPDPPGIRFGPWPGWRGIPPMPAAVLRIGEDMYRGRWDFHGDEEERRSLRCVFDLPAGARGTVILEPGDAGLHPRSAALHAETGLSPSTAPPNEAVRMRRDSPRLLFGSDEIAALKEKSRGTHRAHWARILSLLTTWDLPAEKTETSKTPDDAERLFPEDKVVVSAFLALLEPTPENALRAFSALRAYIDVTGREDFEPLRIDTQSGEVLFTLCTVYDWLREMLSGELRAALEIRLRDVAEICDAFLPPGRHDYAQAHYLGCGMGLLAYAFLFFEKDDRAPAWIERFRRVLERILPMLAEDGFYPHGINLWIYEHGFLFRWLEMFRQCAGIDFWSATPYWNNASRFRAAATSCDHLFGVTFGDPQYRVGGDSWCHYLVAARTGSRDAQRLGDLLLNDPVGGVDFRHIPPRRRVYEFLYHDPRVRSDAAPEGIAHFPDGGQLFRRFEEEGRSMLFTFRCGHPLGAKRHASGERGAYGHSDPMNGAFLLHRGGALLAAGPEGLYRRDTGLFNTITVDGRGQTGDSTVWLPDYFPVERIPGPPSMEIRDGDLFIRAEFGLSYLLHLGVMLCERNLCLRQDGTILGIDRVKLRTKRNIEWRFHSHSPIQSDDPHAHSFSIGDPGDTARLDVCRPLEALAAREMPEFLPAYPNGGTRLHSLVITHAGEEALFVWCISFDPSSRIAMVSESGEDQVRFRTAGGVGWVYDPSLGLRKVTEG